MSRSPFEVTVMIENHPCEVMKLISLMGQKVRVENVKLREQTTYHIVSFDKGIRLLFQELERLIL